MSLDMLCIAGFDGFFKHINPAWTRILGHSHAELLAVPYVEFVHPDDRGSTYSEAAKLTTGADTISFENRYRCKDGSWKWLFWCAKSDIGARLVYAVARDITERKRAEEELRQTAAELKRSNEELAQFAHVASHDLQEPLRMVASFLQLVEKRYADRLDEDGRRYIAFAVDGSKRMQALIQALLSVARVQTQAKPWESTDCARIFHIVLGDLQVAVQEAGATVTCDALPTLMADPTQFGQLLQNLIANSIKFRGSEPARIHVGAVRRPDGWEFTVSDNGIGIEPRYFDRIFGIFQRVHGRSELPGTGIGLTVCRRIVERRGGSIWVESEPERGTAIHFTIPDSKPASRGRAEHLF